MKHTLHNTMTKGETVFGWIYLVAQQFFIPYLLALVIVLLGLPVSDLWVNFLFFLTNFVVVIAAFHKYLAKCLRQLGRHFPLCIGICLGGFLLYWAANMLVSLFIILYFPDFSNANDAFIQTMADDQFWIMFTGSVILVPIVEETLYRGVILGTIDRYSRPLAYVLSTVLFAAIHVVGYIGTDGFTLTDFCISMLQYLPAGACLSWAYARTDTIFTSVLIHTAINLIGMMAMR